MSPPLARCAHQLFEDQAAATPNEVAVVFRDRKLTYRQLDQRANQLAHHLRARGIGPESLVAVCLRRTPDLVVALFAVWKAGAAYVPLDPEYPADRLAFMIGDAQARLLVTEEACAKLVELEGLEILRVDRDWPAVATCSTESPDSGAQPSNLAYVMYTSGSTGRPKGAMIVHAGLVNYLVWAVAFYGLKRGDSVPVHSSIAFDLTVTGLYSPLLCGGHVELLPEDAGAQNLLAALRRKKGRGLVKITPAHLDLLTQQLRPEELTRLARTFVIGGENLPAELLTPWRDFAPETRLINEYGPTETVVGCCVHEVEQRDPVNGPVPIGKPIANTRLYVLDDQMRPVGAGATGELYVGGAGVARGYWNRPDLTGERFPPDPFAAEGGRLYKTGDLARRRPDGVLEYLGRVDDQVKVRGYRIELGEIEGQLAGHPGVQSVTVVVREPTPESRQLAAYLVAREGHSLTASDLGAFARRSLPEYMVPAHFVVLPALPLTRNGKVDRAALPDPGDAALPGGRAGAAPRTRAEKAVAAIWSALLGRERIGLDDDFFRLGGHSLLALKVLAQIRTTVGVELPPSTLFEHSTVAALAALIPEDKIPAAIAPAPAITSTPVTGPVATSFAQEQLWLLEQLTPGTAAYNVVDVVPLPGPFHREALRRALTELVSRHATLRTTVTPGDGVPLQVVHPPFAPDVEEVDLVALPADESAAEWHRLVVRAVRQPFSLAQLPLLRVHAVHASADDHRLLFVVHHVVSDEWSMELVQQELGALYEAFRRGEPSPLPPLPIQYTDFAAWQREHLTGEPRHAELEFWKQELSGCTPILALPTDRPRPPNASLRGATTAFTVPGATYAALRELAQRERASLFMVLHASFAALLGRLTGQDDLLVGTPVSLRTHEETQGLIGLFLNTVALRTRLAPGATFRWLVRQTRDRALAAFAHAAVPFEHVVASVAPERDPARTPLVQALFILHSKDGASQVARVQGNRELHNGSSKFELSAVFAETGGQLEGMFEYATDLFDVETVERLGRSFVTLLDAVATRPEEPLDRLPVLAAPDEQRVLRDWNATHVEPERGSLTLPELFEHQAALTPHATALVVGGEALTYAELDRRATQLAHHLVRLGAAPDVLVGLQVERSVDLVVGLLGILKAGAAYVPLDPSFPPARLAHMVEHSRMALLVSHRDLASRLPVRPPVVVRLDDDAERIAEAAATPDAPRANARHLAYVLYTSGSTGAPKGVGVEHAAIVNFLLSMEKQPGLDASDTLLAITTLSFDIAGLEIYLPLVTGAKVVLATRADAVDPSRLAALLRDSGATVLQATPATWRALVESGWPGVANLKALCGGEALPPELARALLARVHELWNMYGPTETTVWSTLHRMQAADVGAPIGKPIANTDVYVLDVHLQPVGVGAVGELYIGGRGLARGYLHAGALTAERFVQHPFAPGARLYRTGDLARWRGDGELECLGRTDHQVKLRGYRIELGEIESALLTHQTVTQAVVVACEARPGDKRLVAYVVAGAAPDLVEQLRSKLRGVLPEYMLPARYVLLDGLPLTPNGKIDRRALPAPDANEDAGTAPEHEEPPSQVALGLVVVWRRVLGVDRVGVRDSFFELGGNSLSALQLLVEMKRATGIDVSVGTLFRWPTIEQLLAAVGSGATQEGALVVPLQPDGDGRPLFCLCGISLYQELAPHLRRAGPVYGVFAPEEDTLSGRALRGASLELAIEQLARAQYEAIVRVAPHGPYRLAGSSFGGIIAIEVASMMRREGVEVEVVLLLDTLSPQAIHVNRWAWAKRRIEQIFTGEAFSRLKRNLLRLKDRMVAKGLLAGERTAEDLAREAWDAKQRAFFAAVAKWKGGGLRDDFRVVLFRASEQAWGVQHELLDDYGWRHYLRPPVEIVPVKGTHLGILEDPEAEALGQRMQEALARGA